MRCEWKQVLLSDIMKFKNGKKRPATTGDIPVYGGNGILNFTNEANCQNCIVIGRVGAYCGSVFREPQKCWVSDNAICCTAKENSDTIFDYYLLKNLQLNKRHIGTSQPLLTQEILNKIEIICPPLTEQKRIAAILSALDDKIELNQRINDNLERQAQTIYDFMFITDAKPTWQKGHLSNLVTVKYGKDHKKLADGSYPVFGSGGVMRYVERPLYDQESVLIPRKGTLNNVMYVNEPFWSVDTMFYTEMKLLNIAKYVYHFMKSKNLAAMNAGSAVPSMTADILNAIELTIPDTGTLVKFEYLVAPIYLMMEENNRQSRKLSAIRDTLLPKLMAGEIDVRSMNI